MKKALMIASVLFIAVVSTACINNMAVQELNNKAAEYMQKGDYESAMNRLQASLDLDSTFIIFIMFPLKVVLARINGFNARTNLSISSAVLL